MLMVSFLVALVATPIMRRLAIMNGVIDRPSDPRKVHKVPVAYLGGVAVYLGMMAGILFSLFAIRFPALGGVPPHAVDQRGRHRGPCRCRRHRG